MKFNQVIEISRPVENYVYQYAPTVKPKVDKVTFIKYKPLPLCIYLIDNRFLNSFDTRHIVNTIRGGGLIESAAAFLALFLFWQLVSITIDGFIYDHRNPFLGINNQHHRPGRAQKYPPINNIFFPEEKSHCNSNTYLEIQKPSSMPHQQFCDLPKAEKRALPHINDMEMRYDGHPILRVGFYQAKFKVGDHGAIHGLLFEVKSNGGTKTQKTDENTLKMMQSIVDMPTRNNVQWFENGTYQGNTNRGFEAIHIYDIDNKIIAVFNKSTGDFVTTCQLSPDEHYELLETGNFGGGTGWFSGQVRNLPPERNDMNTVETDNTAITPIEDSSLDFTPRNSFENDVISPNVNGTSTNTSELDNQ